MRRFRKWLRRAAIGLGIVLLVLVGVYAARGPLFENALVARIEAASAEVLGGQLKIDSVGGNWLTGATLRGVTLTDGDVVRELQDAEVDVQFDLWRLARGDLAGLERLELRAVRALVDCSGSEGKANDGSPIDVDLFRTMFASGAEVHVEQLELRGALPSTWRGELHADVPPRDDLTESLRANLRVGAAQLQLALAEDSSLNLDGNVPAIEEFVRLFVEVPDDIHATLQTQCVVRVAPEWSMAATGSLTAVSVLGKVVDGVALVCDLDANRLRVSELTATAFETSTRFEEVVLPLSDPLSAQAVLQIDVARLAPWLDGLPAAAQPFGEASGSLRLGLADGVVTVLPRGGMSSLSMSGCEVRAVAGSMPLTNLAELQLSVVAELDERAAAWFSGEASQLQLPILPTGGAVRADLLQRGGTWCVDVAVDVEVRDLDGVGGAVSGPINLRFEDAVVVQPDLSVRGAMLRAADAAQVAGELRWARDVQFDDLTLTLGDGGVLTADGTIASSAAERDGGSWQDVVAASTVALRLDEVALQPIAALVGWPDPGPGKARGTLQLAADSSRAQMTLDVANLVVPKALGLSSAAGARSLGSANLDVDVQFEAGNFTVRSADLRSDALQIQVAGEVVGATLRGLLFSPAKLLRSSASGSVQLAAADLRQVPLPSDVVSASGGLAANFALTGSAENPDVTLHFGDSEASVAIGATTFAKPTGSVRWHAGALQLNDLGLRVQDTQVHLAGSLQRGGDALTGEVRGEVAGTAAGLEPLLVRMRLALDAQQLAITELEVGNKALSVKGTDLTLAASLDELLADPALLGGRDLRGTLHVEANDLRQVVHVLPRLAMRGRAAMDVVLAGTIRQFEPVVDLRLQGASMRIPDGPRLNEITGRITATSREIVCEQWAAGVAGGSVNASGTYRVEESLFGLAGTAWRDGVLDLKVEGKDVLVRRRGGVKVRGDLDVAATGPLANVQLKGTLVTHSSKLVQRYPYFTLGQAGGAAARQGLLFEGPDLGEHVRVNLDLAVTSREPMQIQSNVVTGGVVLALALRGTLRAPRLEGAVSMPEGRVVFPGVSFRTSNALLQFDRDDPFFPTVSLTGTGRRHGFDVRMVVRGRYDQPEIQLSSTPSLPPEQLAVLVATGSRPDALRTTRAVGAVLGSYLVQELADMLFGSESTEAKEGFVSRFEVESGTEISANGTESIVVRFRVVDNVFLEGERDVYEDVNLGIVYRIRFQ